MVKCNFHPHQIMSFHLIVIALFISVGSCDDYSKSDNLPSSSSCGDIHNISCPFYLRGLEPNCSDFSYELFCHNNRTSLSLDTYTKHVFYVEAINYETSLIRIVDSVLGGDNYLCSSNNIRSTYPFRRNSYRFSRGLLIYPSTASRQFNTPITYIDCPAPVNSSARYIPSPPCSSPSSVSSYIIFGPLNSSEVENNCRIRWTTLVSSAWQKIHQTSLFESQDTPENFYGIELPFHYFYCLNCSAPYKSYCARVKEELSYYVCPTTVYTYCDDIRGISFKCGLGDNLQAFSRWFEDNDSSVYKNTGYCGSELYGYSFLIHLSFIV
ncbi:uncharacterized protein LOC135148200 isoform X1 [Daucus carota subsp. sativus]|uniref:uncharacterized protein LOC135148200 isoform X1 n=1 Tax=Daucus carota subsp. sativus TaxID=79200 RepID=UPI003083E539